MHKQALSLCSRKNYMRVVRTPHSTTTTSIAFNFIVGFPYVPCPCCAWRWPAESRPAASDRAEPAAVASQRLRWSLSERPSLSTARLRLWRSGGAFCVTTTQMRTPVFASSIFRYTHRHGIIQVYWKVTSYQLGMAKFTKHLQNRKQKVGKPCTSVTYCNRPSLNKHRTRYRTMKQIDYSTSLMTRNFFETRPSSM
jgi:hypothetical protein